MLNVDGDGGGKEALLPRLCLPRGINAGGGKEALRGCTGTEGHRYHIPRVHFRLVWPVWAQVGAPAAESPPALPPPATPTSLPAPPLELTAKEAPQAPASFSTEQDQVRVTRRVVAPRVGGHLVCTEGERAGYG